MNSDLAKIPPGVRYFFDDEVRLRRSIERDLMSVLEGWSYNEILLPIFDYQDLFARGMGRARASQTYRFTDREGSLLALRPDLTSLVARTVATRFAERPRPLRFCYSGEIFRYDEPRAGRQYEFHHIGIEHVGNNRLEADVEVLLIAVEALQQLGLKDFRITIGNAEFFNGVVERFKLDDVQREEMRRRVDSKNAGELFDFLVAFTDRESALAFCHLTRLAGKREIIDRAGELVSNPKSQRALNELAEIFELATALEIEKFIDIDLGEVGGLDYYTGLIFHIYVPGLGVAVGGGGRYDDLIGNFGQPEAAVGFSLCLDWLAQIIANGEVDQRRLTAPSTEVIKIEGDLGATFKTARQLRQTGRKVLIQSE